MPFALRSVRFAAAGFCRAVRIAALVTLIAAAHSLALGAGKEKATFTEYDLPLYDQIVDRMGHEIAERLGTGRLTRDRYFIVPFAYQNARNNPKYSHSFITAIRVLPQGKKYMADSEHAVEEYKSWNFEAFTVSWLPADFAENPDLCVFSGFGARLFPRLNRCPISPGKNFTVKETIQFAVDAKVAVGMWGPYEIAQPAFELGVQRKRLLGTGTIQYRADDRLYRRDRVASIVSGRCRTWTSPFRTAACSARDSGCGD